MSRVERNTGYKFDLLDREAADEGDSLAQIGGFDTRHSAVGAAAIYGRRFGYDYEVRAFESIWRKTEEPLVCDHCKHEEFYRPLVAWVFASGYGEDGDDGGAFCCKECHRRWAWEHYPESLRRAEQ